MTKKAKAQQPAQTEVFSFGDPIPVLDKREIMEYLECVPMGKWYEPPISLDGLARSFRSSVHHASPLLLKRNLLVRAFIPNEYLSKAAFSRYALEYMIFGNSYIQRVDNRLGDLLRLEVPLAKYMRRGQQLDQFFFVTGYKNEVELERGSVFHLMEPDINQEVYGLPEYIPALNSAWLNEDATLFRRKYYRNGSHAGFILYMTDPAQKQEDVDALRDAIKKSKGPGNFRNLFMYAPNGKKDGIQLIPVSEVAAKDEFFNIKNVTRDDQLAMHRTPPQLVGVVPSNSGGFGDIEKAFSVFSLAEIEPLMGRLQEINDWLGMPVIQFKTLSITSQPEPSRPM